MFFSRNKGDLVRQADQAALLAALDRSQAIIWFDLDGTILDANANFLATIGYGLEDICGQHHRMFLFPGDAESPDYAQFWADLGRGEVMGGSFLRRNAQGQAIWLEASYNPVFDAAGKPVKVVKFATDITERTRAANEAAGRYSAIDRGLCTIEFDLDANILSINANYAALLGRPEHELRGKNLRDIVATAERNSGEVDVLWAQLCRGEAHTGQYRRCHKDGRAIWVEATYSPMINASGKVFKVMGFVRDITDSRVKALDAEGQIAAIHRAQAVIEFDLNGNVLTANENFCRALGYAQADLHGKHHAIFMAPGEADTADYAEFWARLRRGEYHAGEFRRITRNGSELWLQATYNPIHDVDGKPLKVVKFATDVTPRKKAMQAIGTALDHIAAGDLTCAIDQPFEGELEQVRRDLNNAVTRLAEVLSAVADSAQTIRTETADIASASNDLSSRTERQAATLEETAAAIALVTQSTVTASTQTHETSRLVAETKTHAEHSGEVVRETVAAMNRIAESSSQISRITSVIDEIAFQTNLLALNAGVEAARAGEAGKGFAVVASEVRALAQRSSDAAREIAQLITQSSQQVKLGVGLVDQAGAAITGIETAVAEIHSRVADMARAAKDQSNGLAEINTAVNQLDQVTQRNAAMFEETAAATTSLTRAADDLVNHTARFTMAGHASAPNRLRRAS